MHRSLFVFSFIFCWLLLPAQTTPYPYIGAQVFIEPGQTEEQINGYFEKMKANNMSVCRIRLFESHMHVGDNWDFSLYDAAFDAAERNGIKVFATLFPTKKNAGIEGIRFPDTEEELVHIENYIKAVVPHFGSKPAMYVWVLQNEPGWGAGGKVSQSSLLSRKMFSQWLAAQKPDTYDNGYMKADLSDQKFLKDYTTWYLGMVSDLVDKYDPVKHAHHINPHGIFNTLPEYDFKAYEKFLGSLGASMHASWHFDLFSRDRYNLAVSITSDLIRQAAGKNPFWITELQGGNVTYSGKVPLCPTKEETSQWLWTGIGAGAEGVIFWTLNQRGSDKEAGEWGMLDFLGEPSDRLTAASEVSKTILEHKEIFGSAAPVISDITLLYNRESLWLLRLKDPGNRQTVPAKSMTSAMQSFIAVYDALSTYGISPQTESMENFDWDADPKGRVAIICNMISLPSYTWDKIDGFVKRGGKLIILGLTGFYDENMHAIIQTSNPLGPCFGGAISEYKVCGYLFNTCIQPLSLSLPAHLWKGLIRPATAEIIGQDGNGNVTATRNRYGKGEVVWIPSLVGIGSRLANDNSPLSTFLRMETKEAMDSVPFRFSAGHKGIYMRTLKSGSKYVTILINKNPETCPVEIVAPDGLIPESIYGKGCHNGRLMLLEPEIPEVYVWK